MMEERASAIDPGAATLKAAAASPLLGVYAAAAFSTLVWSATPIFTKIAVEGFDPLLVGVLRSVLSGLAILPVALVVRLPLPRTRQDALLLLYTALGGFVVLPILFAFGLRYTTASHMALILVVQPVFTGAIAAVVERRFPGRRWALGCAVALAGEVALIDLRLGLDTAGSTWGDCLILAGSVSASAGYVAGGRLARRIGTWATTVWGNLLGGVIMLVPLAIFGPAAAWQQATLPVWSSLAYLAVCSSIIGYSAWYWALGKGGIARIGAAQFAMPVLTVALAILFLGERLTLPLVLAALVVLAGVWLAQHR